MVDPIPPLSPKLLKRLKKLTDAIRLRAVLYPAPKPTPQRRSWRSRPPEGAVAGRVKPSNLSPQCRRESPS